jgi:hypothetical protein
VMALRRFCCNLRRQIRKGSAGGRDWR